MSDRNVRVRLSLVSSLNSDYSRPEVDVLWEDEFDQEETMYVPVQAVTGGGTTFTTSFLTTGAMPLAIFNEDGTNFVNATIRTVGQAATFVVRIRAGEFFYTADFDPQSNIVLVADTASVACRIFIAGT